MTTVEEIAKAIEPWFNYYTPGGDPQPTHPERVAGAAEAVLKLIEDDNWIVPKIAYDENPSVRPVLLRGGFVRREAGTSHADHTRFYAAQLLAAADAVEAAAGLEVA